MRYCKRQILNTVYSLGAVNTGKIPRAEIGGLFFEVCFRLLALLSLGFQTLAMQACKDPCSRGVHIDEALPIDGFDETC